VRCPACGFAYPVVDGVAALVPDLGAIESLIREAIEAGKQEWYAAPQSDQWTGPYRHHLRKRRAYLDEALGRLLPNRGEGLVGIDAGCGDGNHAAWLRGYVGKLLGSDYNLARLGRARQRVPDGTFFMADLRAYPVRDGVADVIFLNHVLEHIPEDVEVLAEMRRVLKPGGLFVLGVPNEGAAFWRLAFRLQPEAKTQSDHVQYYTLPSLREKARAAGFQIVEEKPIGWGVPHWWLDSQIRGYRWIDDAFEAVGSRLLPSQATSLYLIATPG
jgi:ubiquinone/menaquinone biosynthesis C-methylase UbiE